MADQRGMHSLVISFGWIILGFYVLLSITSGKTKKATGIQIAFLEVV
jgi:hypothetical protein